MCDVLVVVVSLSADSTGFLTWVSPPVESAHQRQKPFLTSCVVPPDLIVGNESLFYLVPLIDKYLQGILVIVSVIGISGAA